MKREFRLSRSSDFQRVRRHGKSYAHPLVVLIADRCPEGVLHIGVAAGRGVGKAVVRNRAKRRIRTAADRLIPRVQNGWDIVLMAREPLQRATYTDLCAGLEGLLRRAGLLKQEVAAEDDHT